MAEVAVEPVLGHEQSEQEAARDVDSDGGPDEGVGVQGQSRDAVAGQHAERSAEADQERRHAG
jgi:hypothetical protein